MHIVPYEDNNPMNFCKEIPTHSGVKKIAKDATYSKYSCVQYDWQLQSEPSQENALLAPLCISVAFPTYCLRFATLTSRLL